jgi:hypothetical protein
VRLDEADQIIDYLSGLLRPPDQQLTRKAWREQLQRIESPELAMRAVINGVQVWEFFPSWPTFMIEYRAVEQRMQPGDTQEKIECRTCLDMGLVLAKTRYDKPSLGTGKGPRPQPNEKRGPFEEWAPCPHCERGKTIEQQQYGDAGYWQGRDTEHIRPVEIEGEGEPEWVPRWRRARAAKDMRPFPQQYEALTPEERPKKPFSDPSAWVQEEEYAYMGEGHA